MIDKELQNRAIEKTRMKMAISNFEKEDIKMNKPKRNLSKMVATFVLALGVTSGLVYATSTVIDKIWKDPEKYVIDQEITEEEKNKCITEEKAEEIGNTYLKQIGFNNEIITSLNLTKTFIENDNIWRMHSKKVSITIDGISGEIKDVQIPTWEYKIPYNYGITRIEARKVATELLEKYKPQNETGEYQLVKLTRNMETDEASYIWYADFYKKYDNLLNPHESVHIGWIPTINGLYSLSFENCNYENNEENITKEQAIEIATQKDKQIEKEKAIKETKAEIKIEQMNENVYLRENFKEDFEKKGILMNYEKSEDNKYKLKDDAVGYKTEERVRKVWVVVIKYDVAESTRVKEFSYFIDCTTGEIIGGSVGDSSTVIETMMSDQYNLIEK